jgi:ribose 5-phosphate isomerase
MTTHTPLLKYLVNAPSYFIPIAIVLRSSVVQSVSKKASCHHGLSISATSFLMVITTTIDGCSTMHPASHAMKGFGSCMNWQAQV